jgi:hypothetical protein
MKKIKDKITGIFSMTFNHRNFIKFLFVFTGIASGIWFLIRVIPKPQRAAYPCMRAAAPVMSGFILYLLNFSGSILFFKKARKHLLQKKYFLAMVFIAIAFVSTFLFISNKTDIIYAKAKNDLLIKSNEPVGVARGLYSGRVVWVHNPGVVTWDGTNGHWWEDSVISQSGAEKMLKYSLTSLTGMTNEADAWDALFRYFNSSKNKLNTGYKQGQKISIKINENNTYSHENNDELNASPQMVYAVLKSLINEAKIPQDDITVFDASRFITNNVFNKSHNDFPDVIFVDNVGGNGRIKATYVDRAIPYSKDNGKLAQGLASCAVEADYIINMALLKGHVGQGVTLCAKNYYGVTSIYNNWRLNAHDNFNQDRSGKPKYMTFVDFLGHKDLGEKTMLFLIDGLYGSKSVDGKPSPKWKMEPFNNDWACSLFASQDGVAIDAVGLDFLRNEWPDAPDMDFAEQYLVEAAQANDPPSKTFYDPENDKTGLGSLGTYEHWNNARDKQYSRNLGANNGIELVKVTL